MTLIAKMLQTDIASTAADSSNRERCPTPIVVIAEPRPRKMVKTERGPANLSSLCRGNFKPKTLGFGRGNDKKLHHGVKATKCLKGMQL